MESSQHSRSLAAGLVAAALAPVVALYIYGAAIDPITVANTGALLLVLFLGLAISLPSALLLGAPFILLLRRFRLLNGYFVCLGAMIIGALSMTAFGFILNNGTLPGQSHIAHLALAARSAVLPGVLFGLLSGLAMSCTSGVSWRARG